MGYDQLNTPILRGTSGGMRYIGCTRRTRKTDAHRTLKYVLIILACRVFDPSSTPSFLFPLLPRRCSSRFEGLPIFVLRFRGQKLARRNETKERDTVGWRCCRNPCVLSATTDPFPRTVSSPSLAAQAVSRNVRCQQPRAAPEIFPGRAPCTGG